MKPRSYPSTTGQQVERGWAFGWVDAIVILGVFALLWLLLSSAATCVSVSMNCTRRRSHSTLPTFRITRHAPCCGCSSPLRRHFSLLSPTATSRPELARGYHKIMLPLLDILQSVPVLGFLSVTVTGFLALFPGSLLGVECASIFAIFTAQAWNMTFGFYHSLVTIPASCRGSLGLWNEPLAALHRGRGAFVGDRADVELMMSFGGGWFFVAQSEAISVLNKNIKLPGLGCVHGIGGRSGRHPRRRLRHAGDDHRHRRSRSARVATAGCVG